MALTQLQRRICLLLAAQRKQNGESYVAGGAALNEVLGGARRSRDVDLFHDTAEALAVTWERDRAALSRAGLKVTPSREGPSFVQAAVGDGSSVEVLQWVQDSAFRFFPLVESEIFGLTLHPFDHATNKVLALAGRRKVRDWVDAILCHESLQQLGYVAWAASGKDPGLSPLFILEQSARTRYVQTELDALDFEGPPPLASALSERWHRALDEARDIVRQLPPEQVGRCVLDREGRLLRASPGDLPAELASGNVAFHQGSIRGAFPELRGGPG
jgi:hypothetical protein